MLRSVTLVAALLIAGLAVPATVSAGEGDARKLALQPTKNAKRSAEKDRRDDAAGRPAEPGEDRRNRLGLDDGFRDCHVYTASDRIPKPYQSYRSAADKARLESEAVLLSLAETVYADEIGQFHDLHDDSAVSFSTKAEHFRLRHRLGARGCAS
ncbi:hypothetical protein JL100_016155 [Skermanella mucosa]|uniref:hypothetical protein n=1 Tax=Skermanella mucosa TaxID=1789672 RepID=UPI00192CE227|nr:hypothetical protein [Skermanella mucosa]UEM18650.1 hypothetical protein JL100_016155 [Skermanella mucosa]